MDKLLCFKTVARTHEHVEIYPPLNLYTVNLPGILGLVLSASLVVDQPNGKSLSAILYVCVFRLYFSIYV